VNQYLLAAALFLIFLVSLYSFVRGRWFTAFLKGLVSSICLLVSFIGLVIVWQIADFELIEYKRKVAELFVVEQGPQRYTLTLTQTEQPNAVFELHGDSWQLDARVVTWTGLPNWLTPVARYRLERLSGRYNSIIQEREVARSVFSINHDRTALQVWEWLGRFPLVPGMSIKYGSSVYLPMEHKASYEVWINHSGLTVVPTSESANTALENWQ